MKEFNWNNKKLIIADAVNGYDKIKAPKGYRILELWELVKLMQETKILSDYERGEFRIFYANKKEESNSYLRLYRLSYGYWYADDDGLACSSGDGRVVFMECEK